jgi:predicted 3-demethylubiquinone-9 3-methyltransferase (glyoxalase superfamily)
MARIIPFLWFKEEAEEAANHYTSVFSDARVIDVQRDGDAATLVSFELEGQEFIALNGAPPSAFNEAISFYTSCSGQDEVDALWHGLIEGGTEGRCGWLRDRYGVSWQIVPTVLTELLADPDPDRAGRVMRAMLSMSRIDIKALQDAYDG